MASPVPPGHHLQAADQKLLTADGHLLTDSDLPGCQKLNADSLTQGPLRAAFGTRYKERRLCQRASELWKQTMQGLSACGRQSWREGSWLAISSGIQLSFEGHTCVGILALLSAG